MKSAMQKLRWLLSKSNPLINIFALIVMVIIIYSIAANLVKNMNYEKIGRFSIFSQEILNCLLVLDYDCDGVKDANDCEPKNPDKWKIATAYFMDQDRDLYWKKSEGTPICIGYETVATLEQEKELFEGKEIDCDDQDPAKYKYLFVYQDNDGDGYGQGDPVEMCAGTKAPTGFSFIDGDCDDRDETKFELKTVYRDDDGDDLGGKEVGIQCVGKMPPAGLSFSGDDCDDQNAEFRKKFELLCLTDLTDINEVVGTQKHCVPEKKDGEEIGLMRGAGLCILPIIDIFQQYVDADEDGFCDGIRTQGSQAKKDSKFCKFNYTYQFHSDDNVYESLRRSLDCNANNPKLHYPALVDGKQACAYPALDEIKINTQELQLQAEFISPQLIHQINFIHKTEKVIIELYKVGTIQSDPFVAWQIYALKYDTEDLEPSKLRDDEYSSPVSFIISNGKEWFFQPIHFWDLDGYDKNLKLLILGQLENFATEKNFQIFQAPNLKINGINKNHDLYLGDKKIETDLISMGFFPKDQLPYVHKFLQASEIEGIEKSKVFKNSSSPNLYYIHKPGGVWAIVKPRLPKFNWKKIPPSINKSPYLAFDAVERYVVYNIYGGEIIESSFLNLILSNLKNLQLTVVDQKNQLFLANPNGNKSFFRTLEKLLTDWQKTYRNLENYESSNLKKDFPVLVWKNPLGDLIPLIKSSYLPISYVEPIIYLYASPGSKFHVHVSTPEGVQKSVPKAVDDSWQVKVTDRNWLLNAADKKLYRYLFWESMGPPQEIPAVGFLVAKKNLPSFFRQKLPLLGLTKVEIEDFLSALWMFNAGPEYFHLYFYSPSEIDKMAKLQVTPTLQSMLRVWVEFIPYDFQYPIKPQVLPKQVRPSAMPYLVEWSCSYR